MVVGRVVDRTLFGAAQFQNAGQAGGMVGVTPAGLQAVAVGQNQGPAVLIQQSQGPGMVGGPQMGMPGGVAPAPKPKVMCQHPGCGKEFAWQQDLYKHVRKYHSGEEPRFTCSHEGCGKRFYERKLLVAHERIHSDERPFACTVPGCDKRFRARNALAYHLKALHNSGEVLKCMVEGCKFTTRKKEALAAHKLRHQQRLAERTWKAQAKGEVQAAVKSVKDDLKGKATELTKAHKALAAEQRAHAKVLKELTALKASHARLKRRVSTTATEIERLRPLKKIKSVVDTLDAAAASSGARAGRKAGAAGTEAEDAAGGGALPYKAPEVVLLDGPSGKLPMLAVSDPPLGPPPAMTLTATNTAGGGDGAAVDGGKGEGGAAGGEGGGAQVMGPPKQPPQQRHPQSILMNVNGTMRWLQPVCAQALPWSTSFIGCPGIKCGEGSNFTHLFKEDGSRDAGNRRTTPLEVEHPKDIAAFHARSTSCPWAKQHVQHTLERASDPVALHALLNDIAPKKPLKVKRVDGQCEGCYAAHVALIARLRAKLHPSKPKTGQRPAAAAQTTTEGVGGTAAADPNTTPEAA